MVLGRTTEDKEDLPHFSISHGRSWFVFSSLDVLFFSLLLGITAPQTESVFTSHYSCGIGRAFIFHYTKNILVGYDCRRKLWVVGESVFVALHHA